MVLNPSRTRDFSVQEKVGLSVIATLRYRPIVSEGYDTDWGGMRDQSP